jgi:hypothetical protein
MPRARGPKPPENNVDVLSPAEQMFEKRLSGVPIRRIAMEHGCTPEEAQNIISSMCASVTAQGRLHSLELELERVDTLQEIFFTKARAGDPQCAAIVIRLQEIRSNLLGLFAPVSYLNSVQLMTQPKQPENTTDKILAALNALANSSGNGSTEPQN